MCKNKTEHHCGFCNMYFKSQLTFDRHQVTPTHLASVKRGGPIVKITFCDTCQIDLSSPKYLRRHLKSEVHQKKLDKLKLLEHLNNSNLAVVSADLKNRDGKVIAQTLMDIEMHKHMLVNHFSICLGPDGDVNIYHDGKSDKLHRYIYYDFYKKKHIPGHPLIDHKNRNPLDNTISNLRPATDVMNSRNKSKRKNTSSNYRGVACRGKNKNSWSCNFLTLEGKHICFYYTQELHAAYHYDLLVKEHKLEYCTPINNIPKPKDFVKKEKDPNKLPQGVGFDIKTQKY